MAFKILSVVGARPNFMKVAAICEAIKEHNANGRRPEDRARLGAHRPALRRQHVGRSFSTTWSLPKPNLFLGVGSGSHSTQTAKVMEGFENVLEREKPQS